MSERGADIEISIVALHVSSLKQTKHCCAWLTATRVCVGGEPLSSSQPPPCPAWLIKTTDGYKYIGPPAIEAAVSSTATTSTTGGAAKGGGAESADSAADAGPQHVDVSDLIGRCGFLCSVQSGKKDALQAVGWRWCTPSLKAPSFKLCL